MKKIMVLFAFILFISGNCFSQTTSRTIVYSGIYKTSRDFKEGRLSYTVNCDSSSGKIKLDHFFSSKYVSVTRNKTKYKLRKDSVFGYRDCKGYDYRFFKNYNYEYQIAEAKSIVIYVVLLPDQSFSGKGIKLVKSYFFSKTLNSDILPLSLSNLKMVFADNVKFCNMLDGESNSDKDISIYDEAHKMYRINYLLTQSL